MIILKDFIHLNQEKINFSLNWKIIYDHLTFYHSKYFIKVKNS